MTQTARNRSSYAYLPSGELSTQSNSIKGQSFNTSWSYDAAGRLSGLSYPAAGLSLSYAYDAYGRLNKVSATLNGQALTLADSFVYQPGSASALAWRLGNNLNRQITRDADAVSYTHLTLPTTSRV